MSQAADYQTGHAFAKHNAIEAEIYQSCDASFIVHKQI